MKSKHFGKCALCGKECELTFEHIPPKAAFNATPVKTVIGNDLFNSNNKPWDLNGLHYDNNQKGGGDYSLCFDCNNKTGAWYGNEYQVFAHMAIDALSKKDQQNNYILVCERFYPLRFIKQVVSMFCSINNDDNSINDLREFVIQKEKTTIDKSKYKICMYFTDSHLYKQIGKTAILKLSGETMILSEISAFPLGFILYFHPNECWEYKGVDITSFCDYRYDDCAEVEIPIEIYDINSWMPEDMRTKEEIEQCIAQNQKWMEEHGDELD